MGAFSHTAARRLRGLPPRPGTLPSQHLALADGRVLTLQRVEPNAWADLPTGTQLLLVRRGRQHLPLEQAVDVATVLDNQLAHPGAPCLALLWGWLPEGEPDTRKATILLRHELATVLRYEFRDTRCPDVVATILPQPN